MVYDNMNIPILIEDKQLRTITYSGLSEDLYRELDWDIKEYFQKRSESSTLLPFGKKTIKTDNRKVDFSYFC